MVRVGETLGGRYELVDVIGRGGMGAVYRAEDRVLRRTVAVKVLPAELAENPTLVERFEREARAAAKLSSPSIVTVFDTGRDPSARYIVMEYVAGISLADLLRERGALPVSRVVEIGAQIASALVVAHAAGIIHRDVKPGNVVIDRAGDAKVLDFGIARARADDALTRATIVLGSASYMSPEVALGGAADERSDIYSLGCVLYEMLTGRPPFIGDLPAAVMNQHASAAPVPPHRLTPAVPPALDALVMEMLAKRPPDRPQRAAVIAVALHESLRAPAAPAVRATGVTLPLRLGPTTSALAASRKRWGAVIAALLITLGVLVALALALIGSSGSQSGSSAGTASTRTPSVSANTTTIGKFGATSTPTTHTIATVTHLTTTTLTRSGSSTTSTAIIATSTAPASSSTTVASRTARASSTTSSLTAPTATSGTAPPGPSVRATSGTSTAP